MGRGARVSYYPALRVDYGVRLAMAFPSVLAAAILLAVVMQNPTDHPVSDRERAGLHGPVRVVVEQETVPSVNGSPWSRATTTEYDPDGRLLAQRFTNPDGSQSETTYSRDSHGRLLRTVSTSARGNSQTTYSYDDAGRLLKVEWSRPGATSTETQYTYDSSGRIVAESLTGDFAWQSEYRYDEHGRKTKTLRVPPRPSDRAVGMMGSLIESAEHGAVAPADGGVVTILYDDRDRATEAQIRNSQGELFSTIVRTYDSAGHVLDEKQVLDNPQFIFPADARAKILAESGGTAEEFNAEVKRVMGGDTGTGMANKYDSQGHLTETRVHVFGHEQIQKFNEHGDEIGEISIQRNVDPNEPGATSSEVVAAERSETRIDYHYDSHGNWTEKTMTSHSADGTAKPGGTFRRTITYYSQ
jgi:YD repeat-containing protein